MHDLIAITPQRADQSGRDAERRYLVAIYQRPDAIGFGKIGRAVIKHHRRAEEQGPENFPRTHHPAHVGHPEKRFVWMEIETMPHVLGTLNGKSAMRMYSTFRSTGCARGVNEHHRVFG